MNESIGTLKQANSEGLKEIKETISDSIGQFSKDMTKSNRETWYSMNESNKLFIETIAR